jgi:hypothetical protein
MKRILTIACITLVTLLPLSLAKGQDKKSEQKIKIIVKDDSGAKVVIDTVFNNSPVPDSLKLKDGSIVYIKHDGDRADSRYHKGKENYNVTYSSGGGDNGKEIKEITVITSDSAQFTHPGDSSKFMTCNKHRSHEGRDNVRYRVISRDSKDHGDREEYIYINRDKGVDENIDNTTDVFLSDEDNDSGVEKSRYVIAKDGMVVTIEGNDETRAKELAELIEEKLGVSNEGSGKKETVKVESKKTIRK